MDDSCCTRDTLKKISKKGGNKKMKAKQLPEQFRVIYTNSELSYCKKCALLKSCGKIRIRCNEISYIEDLALNYYLKKRR